ncbi:unnamed protein product [Aphanomyces euteiches]
METNPPAAASADEAKTPTPSASTPTAEATASSKMEALKIGSATFLAASQSMLAQVNEWEQREKQWKELEARIAFNIANAPNVVTLDVGGTIFKTTKDILLRFEDSYFHVLLGSGVWKPDSAGTAYFIDLDPATFQYIMVYLRTGDLPFEELREWEQKQLRRSLDYLSIELPAEVPSSKWSWDPSRCSSSLALSESNRVVQVVAHNPFTFGASTPISVLESTMAVLGSTSVTSFTLRVESGTLPCIGFASREGFAVNAKASSKYNYFIDMREGVGYENGLSKSKFSRNLFSNGDTLTARWSGNKIEFDQNGRVMAIKFTAHPAAVLFPVVYFKGTAKVSIVS